MSYNILVDFSWVMNVYGHILSDLTYEGLHTGALYGVYNLIGRMSRENPTFNFHFCLDSPCKWRRQLLPGYKGNRDEVPHLNSQIFIDTCRILKSIPNTYFYKCIDAEADDLLALLALQLDNPIIYSGDNDMLQLLPFGVKVAYKYQKGDFLLKDSQYVLERFGVIPEALRYYRFLSGDKSDNIAKITSRVKDAELRAFATSWYYKGYKQALSETSPKLGEQLKQKEDALKINIQLMDLVRQNKGKELPTPIEVTYEERLFIKYGVNKYYGMQIS